MNKGHFVAVAAIGALVGCGSSQQVAPKTPETSSQQVVLTTRETSGHQVGPSDDCDAPPHLVEGPGGEMVDPNLIDTPSGSAGIPPEDVHCLPKPDPDTTPYPGSHAPGTQ
jgi:hypothetical protein